MQIAEESDSAKAYVNRMIKGKDGVVNKVFVEKNPKAMACVKENLQKTHFERKGMTMQMDVMTALYKLEGEKQFDYIFMDPPYSMGLERRIIPYLIESSLVHDDTRIIVEASMEDDPIVLPPTCGWYVERVKEYKNNCHIFICRDKTAVAGEDE